MVENSKIVLFVLIDSIAWSRTINVGCFPYSRVEITIKTTVGLTGLYITQTLNVFEGVVLSHFVNAGRWMLILGGFLSALVPDWKNLWLTINFVAAIILLSLKFGLLGNLINPYLRIMLVILVNILPEDCYKAKKKQFVVE